MPHKPARVILIRKRVALAAGALLAAAAIFCAVNVPAAITAATTARQLPIYCVDRAEDGKKYCAISFDAAWGEEILRQKVFTEVLTFPHRFHIITENQGSFLRYISMFGFTSYYAYYYRFTSIGSKDNL